MLEAQVMSGGKLKIIFSAALPITSRGSPKAAATDHREFPAGDIKNLTERMDPESLYVRIDVVSQEAKE